MWQTVFWVGLSVAFCAFLWFEKTPMVATKYFTAYLMEWSLSIDNIFVFILIFTYFKVKEKDAGRALLIGILLAIVFRMIFIALGIELIDRFHWILYVFGFFLWGPTINGPYVLNGYPNGGVNIATLLDGTDDHISVNGWAREEEVKKGMDAAQITGAASSYARKYALNGLFAIDDTKDADANNEHKDEVGEVKRMELISLLENTTWDEDMKSKVAIKISAITSLEQYNKALKSINQNQTK